MCNLILWISRDRKKCTNASSDNLRPFSFHFQARRNARRLKLKKTSHREHREQIKRRGLLWKRLIDITDSCLSTDGQLSHKSNKMQFKFSSLYFWRSVVDFLLITRQIAREFFSISRGRSLLAGWFKREIFGNKLKMMSIAGKRNKKCHAEATISIVYHCNYRWYKKGGTWERERERHVRKKTATDR